MANKKDYSYFVVTAIKPDKTWALAVIILNSKKKLGAILKVNSEEIKKQSLNVMPFDERGKLANVLAKELMNAAMKLGYHVRLKKETGKTLNGASLGAYDEAEELLKDYIIRDYWKYMWEYLLTQIES